MHQVSQETFEFLFKMLEDKHFIFHTFTSLGTIWIDPKTETAKICFSKDGKSIKFVFGEKFYNKLDDYSKSFILCHECLHIIFKYNKRWQDLLKNSPAKWKFANIAADIAINHFIIDGLEVSFSKLDESLQKELCWVETIFPKEYVPNDRMDEYYFNKLLENKSEDGKLADDHMGYFGIENEDLSEEDFSEEQENNADKFYNNLIEKTKEELRKAGLDEDDIKNLISHPGGLMAGKGKTLAQLIEDKSKERENKGWYSFFKKAIKIPSQTLKEQDNWIFRNRRFVCLSDDLILPTNNEIESGEKLHLAIFMDTSGSCSGFRKYFPNLVKSIPKDFVDYKLHSFSTEVIACPSIEKFYWDNGGTSFSCIEQYIKENYKKYPDNVLIITDGYGDTVIPEHPERWFWLLVDGGSSWHIPNKSFYDTTNHIINNKLNLNQK